VPPDETSEIIGQITEAGVHLVNTNLDLVQRMASRANGETDAGEGAGPAEEAWLAWTESAGDLVQISYLTAQLIDTLWGQRPPPSDTT
jgi:hypothetical protein